MTSRAIDIAENAPVAFAKDPFFDLETEIEPSLWNKSFPYQLAILETGDKAASYYIWDRFSLPIGPEEMSIMTPFAIQTSAVLDGIVEQHNGAPFRMIHFSGTTGVLPSRTTPEGLRGGALSQIGAIFGGTIEAAQRTADAAIAAYSGGPRRTTNLYDEDDPYIQKRTGYYQFRALQRFLEQYVALKKTADGKDKRLALLMWKDQAAYLVSPQQFELRRSAMSPYEYRYALTLRAWRRIDPSTLGEVGPNAWGADRARDTLFFNDVMNRINSGRRAIRSAEKTLKAVYADFDANVMGPLREVTLGLKDLKNLGKTAWDFPESLWKHMQEEWARSWDSLKNTFGVDDPEVQKLEASVIRDGVPSDWPAGFLENAPVYARESVVQALIDDAIARARSYTREDYDRLRNETLARIADFSDRVGVGDATYNELLGRTASPKLRDATEEDYAVLRALSEVAEAYARLASREEEPPQVSNLEYVAGLAALAGISFRVPRSKFAVPFPYGSSLEQLAAHYLGDPERWHEIATLNELRAPYIDEEGFELPLIADGTENTVALAAVPNLYIGQTVSLYANLTVPVKRRIVSIERVQDDYWFVVLDGSVDHLSLADAPKLHVYLPNTVNSQQLIYIPSDAEAELEPNVPTVPGVSDIDAMLAHGGIDLLLTPKGDLAVTPDGDCRVAAGLTNIIQRVRVAFATPRGSMLLHPEFGLEVRPGQSNADFTAKELLDSARAMFKGDPSIAGIDAASVEKLGPVTRLGLEIRVVGSDVPLPIGIDVR